jgi:hypothetical protein
VSAYRIIQERLWGYNVKMIWDAPTKSPHHIKISGPTVYKKYYWSISLIGNSSATAQTGNSG